MRSTQAEVGRSNYKTVFCKFYAQGNQPIIKGCASWVKSVPMPMKDERRGRRKQQRIIKWAGPIQTTMRMHNKIINCTTNTSTNNSIKITHTTTPIPHNNSIAQYHTNNTVLSKSMSGKLKILNRWLNKINSLHKIIVIKQCRLNKKVSIHSNSKIQGK